MGTGTDRPAIGRRFVVGRTKSLPWLGAPIRPAVMVLLAGILLMRSGALPAFAGTLTLHPAGRGDHTYASWQAGQGEVDDQGSANQALYFQKFTTDGSAEALVYIRGLSGTNVGSLSGLSWDHRQNSDSCTVDPQWIVVLSSNGTTVQQTVNCYQADNWAGGTGTCKPLPDPQGNTWCEFDFSGAFAALATQFSGATIEALGIAVEGSNQFHYLDDVSVNGHTWTCACDNGNGAVDNTTVTNELNSYWPNAVLSWILSLTVL